MRMLAALLIAILVLAPSARADDRGVLTAFLEDNLSGAGREVRVEGFSGALSSRATIARLTIADAEGIWLTLDGVTLDWTRSALLRGSLEVRALTADSVILARLPVSDPDALPAPEAAGFALPDLPVSVRIERIASPRIVLGPTVLGSDVEGRLDGSLALSGGEGRGSLLVERTDEGPTGRFALAASFANSSRQLVIDLDAEEGAGGIAAGLLGLPGRPAARVMIDGAGSLANFSADLGLSTDGEERLSGAVKMTATADGGTAFTANLGGDPGPLFQPEYGVFFGDDVRLQVAGLRAADGRFDLSRLDLEGRTFDLNGRLSLSSDGLPQALAFDLKLADPTGAPVLLPLYGEPTRLASASVELGYDSRGDEGWRGRAEVRALDRPDLVIDLLALEGSGRIGRRPDGRAVIGASLAFRAEGLAPADPALGAALGKRIEGRSVLSWMRGSKGAQIGVAEVSGDDFGAVFSGLLEGLASGFSLQGSGQLRADDLSRFAALSGRPLAGRVTADLAGRGSALGGEFDLDATVEGTDLRLGQPEADSLLRGASAIRVSAARGPEGMTLRELKVEAGGGLVAARGGIATAGSDLTAELVLPDLSVLGSGYRGGLSAQAQLSGTPEAGRIVATGTARNIATGIDAIDGLLRGETQLVLEADVVDRGLRIARADLSSPQARIGATGLLSAAGSDLRVDAAIADLGVLGEGYRGGLTASASLTGTAENGRVIVDGKGRGLRFGTPEVDRLLAGESTLAADLARDAGRLTINSARLSNPQGSFEARGTATGGERRIEVVARLANLALLVPEFPGPLGLSGSVMDSASGYRLDLKVQGPGQVAATVKGSVAPRFASADLRIAGTAQAALANAFLGERSINGAASFDLRLKGPPGLAALSGPIRLTGGRLSDPGLPFALTGIDATADLSSGSARLSARAEASTGGGMSVDGRVDLRPPYSGDLAVVLQRLRLRDPTLYETVIDGRIAVTGPLTGGGRIGGALALSETEARIPETGFDATGGLMDVQHVNESAAVRETRRKAGLLGDDASGGAGGGGGGAAFGLDIMVSAPNRIFLRGRGLDLEMGGSLRLGGTTAAVEPSGAFNLIRGRLDILGKRLVINSARLDLQGDLNPFLRAEATTSSVGDQVSVVVEGPLDAPVVSFTSTSGLPQEEVLARLLFGRGVANLSALQAARLAGAVASLAGRGGEGIVSRLRKGFGLDDLDVAQEAEGGVTLRAGRYLSENLYSEVEVSPTGQSRINLNLDLRQGVTVRGSLGNDGQSGLGVFIENDY